MGSWLRQSARPRLRQQSKSVSRSDGLALRRLQTHRIRNRQRLVRAPLDRLDRHENHVLVAEVLQIVHLELAGAVLLVARLARMSRCIRSWCRPSGAGGRARRSPKSRNSSARGDGSRCARRASAGSSIRAASRSRRATRNRRSRSASRPRARTQSSARPATRSSRGSAKPSPSCSSPWHSSVEYGQAIASFAVAGKGPEETCARW